MPVINPITASASFLPAAPIPPSKNNVYKRSPTKSPKAAEMPITIGARKAPTPAVKNVPAPVIAPPIIPPITVPIPLNNAF